MPRNTLHWHQKTSSSKMKEKTAPISSNQEQAIVRIWDCGSPLYDSYELISLSHVIDRNIMVLPSLSGSRQDDQLIKSSPFSHRNVIPSSRKEAAAAAASKKNKPTGCTASSSVLVTFLCKLVKRINYAWKLKRRSICGQRVVVEKQKKMKISNGNYKVCNRIINCSRK
ncbi:hypothetical protein ACH5RR_000099 [Cinchona calisaya]|uniref:Uncharacterized protein n=1 Tax=Cinchona calisaya TaxID=153742 RepID=A0ABD3B0D5_9GENT